MLIDDKSHLKFWANKRQGDSHMSGLEFNLLRLSLDLYL